jgi:hypothetical protein
MLIKEFNNTLDSWIKSVDQYNFIQLCTKPSPASWSLGQVCMHLMDNTDFYIEQIHICLSNDDNLLEEMSVNAKTMFHNNDFPDAVLEGPPENLLTPQPDSREQLMDYLIKLKEEITTIGILISTSQFRGKTKHPGLNYFNAHEWFQFAEMHFRHHLRQKKRIEEFLKGTR